jgi:hypothetical protein
VTISPTFLALLSENRSTPETSDHNDPSAGRGGVKIGNPGSRISLIPAGVDVLLGAPAQAVKKTSARHKIVYFLVGIDFSFAKNPLLRLRD